MKFATKPYNMSHLTLGTLLHYLGKLKIQIFADPLAGEEGAGCPLPKNPTPALGPSSLAFGPSTLRAESAYGFS